MPQVEVPGVGVVDFPDGMSDDDISQAIERDILPPKPTFGQKVKKALLGDLSLAENLKRGAGLTARIPLEAAAALPLAAANAGVGVRNAITGGNAELPSETYRKGLNQVLPEPSGFYEKATNIVGNAVVGSRIPLPQTGTKLGGLLGKPATEQATTFGRSTVKDAALEKARANGYVVPPSTVRPTLLNRSLESLGGKIATQQDASIKNQAVTDKFVKASVGLKYADEVGEATLPTIRAAAGDAYKAVGKAGTLRADTRYSQDLDAIAEKYVGASKDFPDLAKAEVQQAVDAARVKSFDADAGLSAIAILRDKSSAAYAQGEKALGKAYKGIAGALENGIERSLERRGANAKGLLDQYRSARQLIAKTYTAEKALNLSTGQFNAQRIAKEAVKNKAVGGDMKKVAEFATAFPKASQLVLDSGSVRNTDVALGGVTAAVSQKPWYLGYPLLRQGIRQGLLSKPGQALLTRPGKPLVKPTQGLLYGVNAANQ